MQTLWAMCVKTIHLPQCNKDKLFLECQEGAGGSYVEHVFGVLQARFAILRNLAHIRSCMHVYYITQHDCGGCNEYF